MSHSEGHMARPGKPARAWNTIFMMDRLCSTTTSQKEGKEDRCELRHYYSGASDFITRENGCFSLADILTCLTTCPSLRASHQQPHCPGSIPSEAYRL